MHEQQPLLELWLPDIRKNLHLNLGGLIRGEGFKFNKSDFSYTRKHGRDYEQINFLFQNQFPLNYQTSFYIKIWNHPIKQIKQSFPFSRHWEHYKFRSLVIFMGQIRDEMNSTQAPDSTHHFTLITNKDLFSATEFLFSMLQDKVLPLCNQLSQVNGIDSFFAGRPSWSVNTLSLDNISTELIAAKLNRKRDFEEVFRQVAQQMDQKMAKGEMERESGMVMQNLYQYLAGKY